ncbi:hypothetical protein ABTL91_19550, partial [Acinetobacter baumannii]
VFSLLKYGFYKWYLFVNYSSISYYTWAAVSLLKHLQSLTAVVNSSAKLGNYWQTLSRGFCSAVDS